MNPEVDFGQRSIGPLVSLRPGEWLPLEPLRGLSVTLNMGTQVSFSQSVVLCLLGLIC